MAAPSSLPQPEFGIIQGHFTALAEQFSYCANLPGIGEGGAITAILEQLLASSERTEDRLRRIEERLDAAHIARRAR